MSRDTDRSVRTGRTRRLAAATGLVVASMALLFRVPAGYFVAATFLSTSCMVASSYALGLRPAGIPPAKAVVVGLVSAAVLYAVFAAGGAAIAVLHPFGVSASEAASIYSLIVSPGNPAYVQAAVLVFDSAGYESFFRGVLQARLKPSLGQWSAAAVAAFDAALHLLTLNPLWVATTFVADLAWGLTFHYSGRLSSSFASHLVWDLSVFLIFPLR